CGLQVGIEAGRRVRSLRSSQTQSCNHAACLVESGGTSVGGLRSIASSKSISFIETASGAAVIDVLTHQIVFADVADVIDADAGIRTQGFFKSDIHLIRT